MLKKLGLITAMSLASSSLFAQSLDCAALANSALAEPDGYAEQCGTFDRTPSINSVNAPSDIGWNLTLRGDSRPANTFATFALNDFATQTPVGVATNVSIFTLDFDQTGTTLFAIPAASAATNPNTLGTINTTTGAFTPIAAVTGDILPLSPNGMTIDPATGTAYLVTGPNLFTIDLATAVTTLVGPIGTTGGLAIDVAMNCDGQMYVHDIGDDALYSVNPATGAGTLIGPTGLPANFAQGMDFDADDGTLYGFIYTGGGTNTFGSFNLATGAVNALSVNTPLGEFEGAIPTVCRPVDADVSLAKSVSEPTPISVGSTLTFTLSASNAGPAGADGVVVTDTLPSLVTYVSNTCGASVSGSTVTWTIGTLANGSMANCSISATVNGFGTINNTASVASTTNDPTPGNNASTASSFGAQRPYMPIPTLGLWALLLLGLTFTVVGVLVFRNR